MIQGNDIICFSNDPDAATIEMQLPLDGIEAT